MQYYFWLGKDAEDYQMLDAAEKLLDLESMLRFDDEGGFVPGYGGA